MHRPHQPRPLSGPACAALSSTYRTMGKTKLNAATAELVRIDPDTHPLFQKLWNESGMTRIREDNFKTLRDAPGLALLCLVDDPVMYKETFDMVVIGPQLAGMFDDTLSASGFSDPASGRAIASSLGIHRLPAVVLFRFGEMLGAIEGLRTWGEYQREFVQMLMQPVLPRKKTITIASA